MTGHHTEPDEEMTGCRFCGKSAEPRIVDDYETVFSIEDRFPVSEGHHLIVPKRHTPDWFSMTEQERRDADALMRFIKNRLQASDPSITGFNIGMNCGEDAGQSIFHCHVHLIPRRPGDVEKPRGGVRHTIPLKGDY